MGRRIPRPKRQFGVKDPLLQREEREEKIKDKINNPPRNIDEQEVSKKFKKFIAIKNAAKSGKFQSVQKNVNSDFKSSEIDMDRMRRNDNESDYKFMKRVNRITHQRRLEADFAAKYNVEIQRNQETGEIKLKKRSKSEVEEIDELMKKKREESKKGFKKKRINVEKELEASEKPVKISSLQKMKLKKLEKKLVKKKEQEIAFAEYQHEDIKFGEHVLAPPSLALPRKAKKTDGVPRPGSRNLLLTSIVDKDKAEQFEKIEKLKPPKVLYGRVDKKGKRKNLPNSTRIALETERVHAVEMYRQSKKKNQRTFVMPEKNLDDFE